MQNAEFGATVLYYLLIVLVLSAGFDVRFFSNIYNLASVFVKFK